MFTPSDTLYDHSFHAKANALPSDDAGHLQEDAEDKYYETRCILEGRTRQNQVMGSDADLSRDLHAFAALFNRANRAEPECEAAAVTQPTQHDIHKASYIQKWRQGVKENARWDISVQAPTSPTFMSFPGSPVAVVSPAALNVTSLPPYKFSSASDEKRYPFGNRRAATAQLVEEEDYDLDLLLQQHEVQTETEDEDVDGRTESSIVLQAITPPLRPADNTLKLSNQIRWIPSRLKYTLLSAKRKCFWRR
ncbi:uncharacterized protein BT62DRAFT_1004570 [Guyanagaster necrorhizus]|uniref:Uncharacterized protein n=1 Tax=Guyanagaster necrorhizus TaxID=856835 RepID=A0A9P7VUW7_9AGAR|nr:uncharacterized protein BT62DRAFT_1004570 [Guyanagaster necrorhizus MCA 3950]KAG7447808.1 hypothetical protein BT62DRAFT_1004570 [Guyanagaster necrorhizus MCA 3950]